MLRFLSRTSSNFSSLRQFIRPSKLFYSKETAVDLKELEAIQEKEDKEAAEKEKKEKEDEQAIEFARLKKLREDLKEKYKNNPKELMEFFEPIENWGKQDVRSGRAWKMEELRCRSNADLHKLWYILLKERNMLLTMEEAAKDQNELFPSPERIDKVEESMANLEDVVKERNKAYYELEVAEGETGMRPAAFRRDLFGRHQMVGMSQHLIPYWMNNQWRHLYGPCYGPHVRKFIKRLREKKANRLRVIILMESREVRQILRRFPETDIEYLQEKFPRVDVQEMKRELQYFEDFKFISPGTSRPLIDESS